MKIAVTSTGPTLDDPISAEFDRSKYMLIIDFDTLVCEKMISPVMRDSDPDAGESLVRQLLKAGVSKILVCHVGTSVLKSLSKSLKGRDIQIVDGMTGSGRSAIRQFTDISMAETAVIPREKILN